MKVFKFIFLLISFLSLNLDLIAQSNSELKKKAEEYYQQSNYIEASKIYVKLLHQTLGRKDLEIAAETFSATNQLEKLTSTYELLIKEKKKCKKYRLEYAEALHHLNKFTEASKAYKDYLKLLKKKDPNRIVIEQKILQCLNGVQLRRKDKNSIVEPLNATMNTQYDEFAPLPSINHQGRYYFSAVRNSQGRSKQISVLKNADIYTIEDNNGNWSIIKSLTSGVNTDDNEVIIDFINDGQGIIIMRTNLESNNSEIISKNFNFKDPVKSNSEIVPIDHLNGEFDLCLFQDSICIFSSRVPGGFGSKDLYLSIFRNGKWTHPKNLGSIINSAFDEVNPFLAKDGRTLYFSSNSLKSIGGFDVFKTEFLAESNTWSVPINLGIPINTAADEHEFKLNRNGLSGVFSSNRKDLSKGGKDIFISYFKEELEEQFYDENGSVLTYYLDYSYAINTKSSSEKKPANVLRSPAKIIACDVIISAEDEFLNNLSNKKTLQIIMDILQQYPSIQLQCVSHSSESNNAMINLFSSTKKAEQLTEYLKSNGISESRIQVIGVGSYFSIANKNFKTLINSQEQFQNNRIEYYFTSVPSEEISIQYNKLSIPDSFKNLDQFKYQNSRNGLSYSCLIGESTQMLDKDLNNLNASTIFCEFRNGKYYYYYGIVNKLSDAKEIIVKYNFPKSTTIQAYIDGKFIEQKSIINYATQFPDLILLMDYNKAIK